LHYMKSEYNVNKKLISEEVRMAAWIFINSNSSLQ